MKMSDVIAQISCFNSLHDCLCYYHKKHCFVIGPVKLYNTALQEVENASEENVQKDHTEKKIRQV